jgi:UDP-glucuronate 4-epimerase
VTDKVLITGAAGFIGFHLSQRLMRNGFNVVGIDNLNDYYDPALKQMRLAALGETKEETSAEFQFLEMDLADREAITYLFKQEKFDVVINLAAQAGVRYSLENPHAYADANLTGFLNILEGCRHNKPKHLIFASSSSVYGMNTKTPFSASDNTDYPISLYAATKKSNELMAHAYAHLYGIPSTGLRFFTVYGPYGRPDMAYFKFTKAILGGQAIDVYNNGAMQRDFTYINDIIEGIVRLMPKAPVKQKPETSNAEAPFKVYNIGNNNPVELSRFIKAIEMATGIEAKRNNLPMQAGDVPVTYADVDDLMADVGFKPDTSIEEGIERFVSWYREYLNFTNNMSAVS